MKTTVQFNQVFSGGSGAPAIVTYAGFRFAADFLGEARLHNLVVG